MAPAHRRAMSRAMRWLLSAIILAACATTPVAKGPDPLPCADDDAPRCLAFLALMNEEESIAHALERYCVSGRSLEACQELAKRRRDRNLERLCRDGTAEACPLPTGAARSAEALRRDCLARVPGTCRPLFEKLRGAPSAAQLREDGGTSSVDLHEPGLLEATCAEGLAVACFELSQVLHEGHGTPKDEKRAQTLAWHACLAGVPAACAASDVSANKCAQGNESACAAFWLTGTGIPDPNDPKVKVLTSACEHGATGPCRQLVDTRAMPLARAVALTCIDEPRCVHFLSSRPPTDIASTCQTGSGLAKAVSCLMAFEYCGGMDEAMRPAVAWAEKACGDGRKEACAKLVARDLRGGHRLAAMTLACREHLGSCEPADAEGVAHAERCAATNAVDACFRAARWLDTDDRAGEGDLPRAVSAYRIACDGGELAACTRAAALLVGNPDVDLRITLLNKACALKSEEACTHLEPLAKAKRQCGQGHCVEWYLLLDRAGVPARTALPILEGPCLKGSARDCRVWNDNAPADLEYWLGRCSAAARLCDPYIAPIVERWRSCTGQRPRECSKLVTDLLNVLPVQRRETPELVAWSMRACQADDAIGCVQVGLLSNDTTPEWRTAIEKGCALENTEACVALAKRLWNEVKEESRAEGRNLEQLRGDAKLKRSIELANQACRADDADGCELAAEFAEGPLVEKPDPVAAERLRQRARDLQAKKR